MKTKFLKRLSLLLALLMLISCLGVLSACKDNKNPVSTTDGQTTAPDNGTPPVDNTKPTAKEVKYYDTEGKTILRANFSKKLDTPDEASPYQLVKSGSGAPEASVKVIWNSTGLYLTIAHNKADSISIVSGSFSTTLTPGNGATTVQLTAEQLGITIADLGQYIPLTVTVTSGETNATFDGFAQLYNADVFYTNACSSIDTLTTSVVIKGSPNTSTRGMDVGAMVKSGDLNLYDRYSLAKNAANMRIEAIAEDLTELGGSAKTTMFECDLQIKAMPIFDAEFISKNDALGLSFIMVPAKTTASSLFGLLNSNSGLHFFVNNGTELQLASIGKQVGDQFHLGVKVQSNGTVIVYIDNREIASFENATTQRTSFTTNTLTVFWQRNNVAATSDADSFDALIDNLSVAFENTTYVADSIEAKDLFGDAAVVNATDGVYLAPSNLNFENSITSKKYGITTPLRWKISNTDIISEDGIVTKPTSAGEVVDVTVYLFGGDYVASERTFRFFVRATAPASNVLQVPSDTNPYYGAGESADVCFTLGSGSSIVYDMGSVTNVKNVHVAGLSDVSKFVAKNFFSLYVSDDNETYRRVEDFSLLQSGSDVYFYNFSETARYIKVHNTESISTGTVLSNSLQKMMTASADDNMLLLSGGGSYAKSLDISINNSSSKVMNDVVTSYTLADLGINAADLKADCSDIRFTAGDNLLPHYYSNGVFYVRVLEIPANGKTDIKIYYGNESASSVSDGNETFEVQYGTKLTPQKPANVWRTSVAQMPNGDLLQMGVINSRDNSCLGMERSTDGGYTWTTTQAVAASKLQGNYRTDGAGGFVVDKENNTVFYLCWKREYVNNQWLGVGPEIVIYKSTDSGYTWKVVDYNNGADPYIGITYSDGIKLSGYDGTGPNIDYIVPQMQLRSSDSMLHASSIYSKDGGNTWQFSETVIGYDPAFGSDDFFEGGTSESTIVEQSDGTLVIYMRAQYRNGNNRFGMAYSYDHGVTWDAIAYPSGVYAPNTQPIMDKLLDGTAILMWGGHNSMGTDSHLRYPLSIAYSLTEGDSFIGIQDATFQTYYSDRLNKYEITNPDIVIYEYNGVQMAYIITTSYAFIIEDIGSYLTMTKGAFDSFENCFLENEGWLTVEGNASVSTIGATDGTSSMQINSKSTVSRSLPYTEKGTVLFDLYFVSLGDGMQIEFQPAYNQYTNRCAAMALIIDADGNVQTKNANGTIESTGLKVIVGNNSISITFDGTSNSATLTVNGQSVTIGFDTALGNYICNVNIWNSENTISCIDRFTLIGE